MNTGYGRSYVEEQKKSGDIPASATRGKTIGTILFVLVNIGVIIVTAYLEFSKDASHAQKVPFLGLNFRFIFAAIGCVLLMIGAETAKYMVMMKATLGSADLKTAFQVTAIGKYYDNITPLGTGGQPFQIYFLSKRGHSKGAAASLPITSYICTNVAFAILAVTVMIFGSGAVGSVAVHIAARIGILCYLFVPATITLFTVAPRAADAILCFFIRIFHRLHIIKDERVTRNKVLLSVDEYRTAIRRMSAKRGMLALLLLLSLIYHSAMCSLPFFVLRTFGGATSWATSFCICVFIYAAVTFVPTPGNSGAAEGSFYALFSGLTSGYLFWAMLVWRFFCYYYFILQGGCVFGFNALMRHRNKKRLQTNEIIREGKE